MQYTFCPADPVWYATDLRLDVRRGMLQWTGGRGQDALLLRTPYGVDPDAMMDNLCAALARTDLREGRFTELLPTRGTGSGTASGGSPGPGRGSGGAELPSGTAARLVGALEKAKHNGCPLDGEARTYTVFACRTEGERRFLYGHQRGEISSPRCDVPLRLKVKVEAVKPRGLFVRRDAGYYRISFPPDCPEGCQDGDLEYWVDDFAVPVTRRMIAAGAVYVRTDLRPRMVSRAAGLALEGG
ncbi:MAG: hypothetical protein IJT94_10950 [Oscillibacter sp.]|nr:hypothetical protein [Oscillibacter sp.]